VKAFLTWIQQNPSAVKAYLLAVIALIAKGILAVTGKVADLGQWSGFVDQAIDLLVGGLSFYGVIAGTIHVSRGPALTTTDQASVIVAALLPAPASAAVETVKTIVADVVAVKPESPPVTFWLICILSYPACSSFPPLTVGAGFAGATVQVSTPGWSAPVPVVASTVITKPTLLVPDTSPAATELTAQVEASSSIQATSVPVVVAPVAQPTLAVPVAK
jgi:hypothetical protein